MDAVRKSKEGPEGKQGPGSETQEWQEKRQEEASHTLPDDPATFSHTRGENPYYTLCYGSSPCASSCVYMSTCVRTKLAITAPECDLCYQAMVRIEY